MDSLGNGTALRLHGGRTGLSSSIRGLIPWLLKALEIGGYLLYVPLGLTFSDSTFCLHTVFICFVWI